jgi:hypothetical protein
MRPLGKMLKIKPDLIENSNTIHTLGEPKFGNTGMIIDAGPEVTEFKLGQKILFKKFTPSEEDGNRFGYIHEEDVLGIMFSEN